MRRLRRTALVVLIAAALLAGVFFALRRLWSGSGPDSVPDSGSQTGSSTVQLSSTPEPSGGQIAVAHTTDADWNRSDYAVRTLDTTVQGQDDGSTAMDFRLAGQASGAGTAELSWFDGAVFLGDSLSHGMQIYETGLPNAQYCVYTGAGPQSVVNGQAVKRASDKVAEVILDALVAKSPDRIYVLFGTNVLTRDTSYASFIAYYGQMLDMIQAALPGTPIYVQSITPVRPGLRSEKPGLYKERLMRINDELAALALEKGCYFIDLWEALADENGDLKADIAQSDGYHIKPAGYTLWVEYLRTHTVYTPGVAYVPGTSYYIEQ